jgi:hypothetical protein
VHACLRASRRPKFSNSFYLPDNIPVEFGWFGPWNPILLMNCGTDRFHLEAFQKFDANLKSGDEACPYCGICCVPVPRELRRVFLVQDGIETGLAFETRRELPESGFFNAIVFLRANRSEQRS